jgi:hypothetical protein
MTPTRIDFTLRIDTKGYQIVPPKRPPKMEGQSESDWILNSRGRDWVEARIVGLGGRERSVTLNNYPMLFNTFAKVTTSEELLKFITQYGSLTPTGRAGGKGDDIPRLLDEAKLMKAGFEKRGRNLPTWPMANLKAWLKADKTTGNVSIRIAPVRLLDALWLQLGQAMSGGTQWRQCKHCHDWFPVGGKTGKRSVSTFCTDEHRIEYNSLQRSRRK